MSSRNFLNGYLMCCYGIRGGHVVVAAGVVTTTRQYVDCGAEEVEE